MDARITRTITVEFRLRPAVREQYDAKFNESLLDWQEFYTIVMDLPEDFLVKTPRDPLFEFRTKPTN